MDSRLLFAQYLVKREKLMIGRVKGTENMADIGTKDHPMDKFEALRAMCNIVPSDEIIADGVEISAVARTMKGVDEDLKESSNKLELADAILALVRALRSLA